MRIIETSEAAETKNNDRLLDFAQKLTSQRRQVNSPPVNTEAVYSGNLLPVAIALRETNSSFVFGFFEKPVPTFHHQRRLAPVGYFVFSKQSYLNPNLPPSTQIIYISTTDALIKDLAVTDNHLCTDKYFLPIFRKIQHSDNRALSLDFGPSKEQRRASAIKRLLAKENLKSADRDDLLSLNHVPVPDNSEGSATQQSRLDRGIHLNIGLGKKLFKYAVATMKSLGYEKLIVNVANTDSQRLIKSAVKNRLVEVVSETPPENGRVLEYELAVL